MALHMLVVGGASSLRHASHDLLGHRGVSSQHTHVIQRKPQGAAVLHNHLQRGLDHFLDDCTRQASARQLIRDEKLVSLHMGGSTKEWQAQQCLRALCARQCLELRAVPYKVAQRRETHSRREPLPRGLELLEC